MKILLNENLPTKAKYDFGESHQVFTVKDMRWLGKKNGELLGLAALNDFDIFITTDKNLKNQQNLNKVNVKIIVLLAHDNKHQTLQPLIVKIKLLLQESTVSNFIEISV